MLFTMLITTFDANKTWKFFKWSMEIHSIICPLMHSKALHKGVILKTHQCAHWPTACAQLSATNPLCALHSHHCSTCKRSLLSQPVHNLGPRSWQRCCHNQIEVLWCSNDIVDLKVCCDVLAVAKDKNGALKGVCVMKTGVILGIGIGNKLHTFDVPNSNWLTIVIWWLAQQQCLMPLHWGLGLTMNFVQEQIWMLIGQQHWTKEDWWLEFWLCRTGPSGHGVCWQWTPHWGQSQFLIGQRHWTKVEWSMMSPSCAMATSWQWELTMPFAPNPICVPFHWGFLTEKVGWCTELQCLFTVSTAQIAPKMSLVFPTTAHNKLPKERKMFTVKVPHITAN